ARDDCRRERVVLATVRPHQRRSAVVGLRRGGGLGLDRGHLLGRGLLARGGVVRRGVDRRGVRRGGGRGAGRRGGALRCGAALRGAGGEREAEQRRPQQRTASEGAAAEAPGLGRWSAVSGHQASVSVPVRGRRPVPPSPEALLRGQAARRPRGERIRRVRAGRPGGLGTGPAPHASCDATPHWAVRSPCTARPLCAAKPPCAARPPWAVRPPCDVLPPREASPGLTKVCSASTAAPTAQGWGCTWETVTVASVPRLRARAV